MSIFVELHGLAGGIFDAHSGFFLIIDIKGARADRRKSRWAFLAKGDGLRTRAAYAMPFARG